MSTNEKLLDFCCTDHQRETVQAIIDCGGDKAAAARKLGSSRSTVRTIFDRVKSKAGLQSLGIADGHISDENKDLLRLKGTTTLYHAEKGELMQWIKTSIDEKKRLEMLEEVIKGMAEDVPRAEPVTPPTHTEHNLANCYILTDYHLGMYAWHEESGANWDIKRAERLLINWFSAAIERSPNAEVGILAQLGDFLHWDGLDAVTPANRNILDADTRFAMLTRVAIRVLRRVIAMLLAKHQQVHVITAEGNHDIASSAWLRELLHALYDEEPRVTVDVTPAPYYCYEHGRTSLFFHHGHLRKQANISSVFASKFRDAYGRTTHSYAHMGHLHSKEQREDNLMVVEQHPTLAAMDAYAARHGYINARNASVITYHKDHGEVGRVTLTPNSVSVT